MESMDSNDSLRSILPDVFDRSVFNVPSISSCSSPSIDVYCLNIWQMDVRDIDGAMLLLTSVSSSAGLGVTMTFAAETILGKHQSLSSSGWVDGLFWRCAYQSGTWEESSPFFSNHFEILSTRIFSSRPCVDVNGDRAFTCCPSSSCNNVTSNLTDMPCNNSLFNTDFSVFEHGVGRVVSSNRSTHPSKMCMYMDVRSSTLDDVERA